MCQNISASHAGYPAGMLPGFISLHNPTKYSLDMQPETCNTNYYQSAQKENYGIPSREWGVQRASYTPNPDRGFNVARAVKRPGMPQSSFVIDKYGQSAIDNFYLACQLWREQYKDHSGKLHPLDFFRERRHLWQCQPSMTPTYLKFPQYYVPYAAPTVLATSLGRTSGLPPLPVRTLVGRVDRASDIRRMR